MPISPYAGKLLPLDMLVDLPQLESAYYNNKPDVSIPEQRVSFGTSGHRGSSLNTSFNENHVLAITQAICDYRSKEGINGPLFIGIDTHALSEPAQISAVEVLAANGVNIMLAKGGDYTPTPAISHAILTYNKGRATGLSDGIVITPSHNPPDNGGFKYNPTNGGPADSDITNWIQARANELLQNQLRDVKRMNYLQAVKASTTHHHDYVQAYVSDLYKVIDMDAIRGANIHMGADPLGGAGIHYWQAIADMYQLNLKVLNTSVDKTFAFMTADWDGKIRMDPSSAYTMQGMVARRHEYDVAFACDTDHDRHGIVAPSCGLLPPNHYLAVAIEFLFQHRPQWGVNTAVGKTLVSSAMIDKVAQKLGRRLHEVPVGFKWFAPGLYDGSLGFGGEESAGASFLRIDGSVWTTDKDGIIPALLSAEIKAKTGRDPGECYKALADEFGHAAEARVEAPANSEQKKALAKLSAAQITSTELAGDAIEQIITHAPANNAPLGGIKVVTGSGWFAARPSGTEEIYKIYAESFKGKDHLQQLISEAQTIVDKAIA
ncbi:phosphoglucomutase (alpha-D-glucose-1,6-bisphosphate-dependent) [Cellvibrio japonicus]|uniref:Phosphoglucomutase n=1 Tax=Cellvibrio japonicus (strain Ueda107) TaxID=498211 RepID=B3PGN6_CELJU|nr:phosphoglucomutase (alpha-D-glucose-1,6-bisphosphate-dependent) [Cellvibrio japonicus]ACE84094.1 phosphoglucomutase, alpha-D-glucose phosphate-specific [Cellvibrio japonicus Ueda107]QEI12382.1 alpha-D-glucose phosphate-specific phosphoglucomutase [Cellvibrio japonicus]QEI15955.1 alpha-D-glucose phosphate-specific phosphoglucomutase [Cellvibrio japonicus]QEI19534.1 alpha-D-glucose phosphate-specific phosphoglucomutase [Cellvibrio japonicus]